MTSNENIVKDPKELLKALDTLHPNDIANSLRKIANENIEDFFDILRKISEDSLGEVLLELPDALREEAYKNLSIEKLTDAVDELDSDDATDIIQELEEIDESRAREVFEGLEEEDKQDISWLKRYEDNEAGSYMQTELFSVLLDESIGSSVLRLKQMKEEGLAKNIHQVFVVNEHKSLQAAIYLEDLIIYDFDKTYADVIKNDENNFKATSVQDDEDITKVAQIFENYDLAVVPVVGYQGILLGRITSDDILDVVEQNATQQIYQLAGVDDEYEHEDDLFHTSKKRATWLFVNLLTAILASLVIGLFDKTIESFVALAVLMPIVASMGGNAGTQTLTVMVRQLALGLIDYDNSKAAIKKEILVSLINGFVFALIIGIVAYFWFHIPLLGLVIALSMIINLFSAGLFGASIPLVLKKFNIDPAIGSTVLLTTVTDIVGFFSFLGLAKLILL